MASCQTAGLMMEDVLRNDWFAAGGRLLGGIRFCVHRLCNYLVARRRHYRWNPPATDAFKGSFSLRASCPHLLCTSIVAAWIAHAER
jgi:hypothetical protein